MHARLIPSIFLLFLTTIRAASIAEIASDNEELTKTAVTVDAAVVAFGAESGFQAAQQIPYSLYGLTRAVAASGSNNSRTGTEPTSDPALENLVTSSYGLLTNVVEELMFDLYVKETILASYHQRRAVYRQILYFNSTFVRYSDFMHSIVGDELHQELIHNATANAIVGIVNATGKYAPGQTVMLFKA